MQILAKSLTASAAITGAACYVLSCKGGLSNDETTVYHGSAATSGNEVLAAVSIDGKAAGDYCELPGIYCADGIYMKVDHGCGIVRYYH